MNCNSDEFSVSKLKLNGVLVLSTNDINFSHVAHVNYVESYQAGILRTIHVEYIFLVRRSCGFAIMFL